MLFAVVSGPRRNVPAVAVVLSALGLVLLLSSGAPARAAVPSCRVGAYVAAIYDVDPGHNAFSARLDVWSLCPRADLDPIPNMLFSNGYEPAKSNPVTTTSKGVYRHLTVVDGKFRQGWNLKDFPFDRHDIDIVFTSSRDDSQFRFEADDRNSAYDSGTSVPGWKVTGMRLAVLDHRFVTNFGDPTLPPGSGIGYSRLNVRISLERDVAFTLFWQLISPIVMVFVITSLTFLLSDPNANFFQSRLGVLGASVFTVLLSMNKVDASLPPDSGLNLIDELHLLVLGYVLLGVCIAVAGWLMVVRGYAEATIRRLSRAGFVSGMVGCAGGGVLLTLVTASGY
ncbi:hypothetical protein ACFP1Z_05970 [Streptomyces gamaensis]|uniref:Neurotransmitter-gated ion-channel ligand-binding domain-containing protein n=1 Tax=Streptomyces gamaensis TaxID=1763542 RepID=A0ABW0YT78_9ACTN